MPTHLFVEQLKTRRSELMDSVGKIHAELDTLTRVIDFYDDDATGGAPVADKVRKAERAPKPAKRGRKAKGTAKAGTGKAAITLAERKSRGQKIDEMIIAGKSSQDIVDALDGTVTISNVSVRKSKLKADGKL